MLRRILFSFAFILLAHLSLSAQESSPARPAQCPALSIDCPIVPSDTASSYQTLTATLSGADPQAKLIFNWTVSHGAIDRGQTTPSITISGFVNEFTVTVEVQGLPQGCSNTASCSMVWDTAPPPRKFDEYEKLSFSNEKRRLDSLAVELQNNPGVQAYLIAYGVKTDRRAKTQAWLKRAKDYLLKQHNLEDERIVTVDGGLRESPTMEVWLVPTGATPPPPAPTVESN